MEITPKALQELKKMVDLEKSPLTGIRISLLPGFSAPVPQMSVVEKPEAGDVVVSIDAVNFYFDKQTEKELSGYAIDFNSNGFRLDYMLSQRCCK
jgi:Fe-S cluster assembly iron-binding protein IscA